MRFFGAVWVAVVWVAVVAVVLGTSGPAMAIAHGASVPAGRYGFAARLVMTGIPTEGGGSRDSWCSGALVTARWVITAGHCFRDSQGTRVDRPVARKTTVTFYEGGGTQQATVVKVRQSSTNDVALAELDRDITGVTPIAISHDAPTAGEKVRLTGYGATSEGGSAPSHLQTGGFVITATGGTVVSVTGSSPRRDTSPCLHDSGAPYFREQSEPELVSVVSGGPPCPHTGPDEAARVDVISGWISQTVRGGKAFPWRTGMISVLGLAVASGLVIRRSMKKRWA